MRFFNVPNIYAVGLVLNTTRNSTPQQLLNSYSFSIQIVFTGTPTGTFKLQASDDPAAESVAYGSAATVKPPSHWTDVDNSTFTVSAAGNVMWNYSMPGFNWVRVVFLDGSAGASTAIIASSNFNAKGG